MSFAKHLADLLNKIYFYVRKQIKGYGIKSRLVGDLNMLKGKAVLIEDLITDGRSKISFILNLGQKKEILNGSTKILKKRRN